MRMIIGGIILSFWVSLAGFMDYEQKCVLKNNKRWGITKGF